MRPGYRGVFVPGKSDLFAAIKANDVEKVSRLLDGDPSLVDARSESGDSALLTAVYSGAGEIVDLLLRHGFQPDVFEAAAVGQTDTLRTLIENDPQVINTYSHDEWTALHLACFFGHTHAVTLLLQNGAHVDTWSKNSMGNQPLHAACAGMGSHQVVQKLLDADAPVNTAEHGGYTALHLAAARGDLELVSLLVRRGADPTAKTDKGETAADIAASRGYPEAAALLAPNLETASE